MEKLKSCCEVMAEGRHARLADSKAHTANRVVTLTLIKREGSPMQCAESQVSKEELVL